MPLRLERFGNRQLWLPLCDRCQEPGVPLTGYDSTREVDFANPEALSDLDQLIILCDVCQQTSSPFTDTLNVRDALIDHLRSLPGGQDLDFTPGSTIRLVVDALAMGEPREDVATRLFSISPSIILELDEELVGRPAANFLRRAIHNHDEAAKRTPSSSTTVVMSKTTCELPEWVVVGVWVRRHSDMVKARVVEIEPFTVILNLGNKLVTWCRTKNARFEKAFTQLPPPPNRWERLLSEEDPFEDGSL